MILAPITGLVSFSIYSDDGSSVYMDDIQETFGFGSVVLNNYNFNFVFNQITYYSLYTEWCQGVGGYVFKLYWSYPGVSTTLIPNSNIFLPTLFGSSPYNINIYPSIWGDGFRMLAEVFDDSNTFNSDGWSASWLIESGWSCTGGTINSKDICTEIWGDGRRFNSNITYWDDNNLTNGDGWNSSWNIEVGWKWSGGSQTNKDSCTEIWGDGKKFNSIFTYWDDNNLINGDGWNSSCGIEVGWKWSGGGPTNKDVCNDIWGDGKIFWMDNGKYWDDGNTRGGDGWSSTWSVEVGWIWVGGNICFEI